MKKTILLITFLTISVSCKNKNDKSDFIGNWSTTSDTKTQKIDISFFKDSMVINDSFYLGTYSNKWKIKDSKIEQSLLRGDTNILKTQNNINFIFNSTKDTLLLKHENDSKTYIKFRKIKNTFEYFENEIGLKIQLKESEKPIVQIDNNQFNFNIYLTKKKNRLITKTDYANNLNNLITQIIQFETLFTKKEKEKLRFTLFSDKRVSEKQIDSIKSLLSSYSIKNVFEVYKYKENVWNEEPIWLGTYDN
ncbi:hypothetical protein ACOSP6_00315 [Tenacibaculum sp. MEBiC06402]|uniref:hypothetical protein n=1 Tax=unclassified Tenacibaculum TaxID=2635139 RepID=UPI003B9B141E